MLPPPMVSIADIAYTSRSGGDEARVLLDERPPGLDLIAHEHREHQIGGSGVLHRHLDQRPGGRIHRRVAQLVGAISPNPLKRHVIDAPSGRPRGSPARNSSKLGRLSGLVAERDRERGGARPAPPGRGGRRRDAGTRSPPAPRGAHGGCWPARSCGSIVRTTISIASSTRSSVRWASPFWDSVRTWRRRPSTSVICSSSSRSSCTNATIAVSVCRPQRRGPALVLLQQPGKALPAGVRELELLAVVVEDLDLLELVAEQDVLELGLALDVAVLAPLAQGGTAAAWRCTRSRPRSAAASRGTEG